MSLLKRYCDYIIIILLLVFTVLPLFHSGFFPIQDNEQVGRVFELNKDIINGEFPPRMAQDLGFGFDYPLFSFYPSFVYYVSEIFHLIGFTYINSIKLMIGVGFILAALFMYLFSKQYVGRIGGIVAAIAYSYTPYHSVDVYVRGALPEFWSYVFIPAVFWSIYKLATTNKVKYVILSGFFAACLIVTHDLMAMMSSFFLGTYFLYLIFQSKKKLKLFEKICLSMILGLCFAAYFWIPSYFEKQFTMVNLLTTQLADYHRYFVCIRQFVNSPWGYGASVPGCFDGLSFQVGQAQLAIGAISVIVTLFFLWKNKLKISSYVPILLFIGMFIFSLFIQTKYSLFIWDHIQQFAYIQFPWRFLTFSDFTISFIGAYMFTFIKKEQIKVAIALVFIVVLILMNKDFFVPKNYITNATDLNYTAQSVLRWTTSLESFEYTPIGIATEMSVYGNSVIAITKNEIPKNGFEIISGKMHVKQVEDIPQQKEFRVTVSKSGLFRFNTFTFPGWITFIDGKQVNYTANNTLKLITISLPKGTHTIRASLTDTPIRSFSNYLSLVSVISVIFYYAVKKLKKQV